MSKDYPKTLVDWEFYQLEKKKDEELLASYFQFSIIVSLVLLAILIVIATAGPVHASSVHIDMEKIKMIESSGNPGAWNKKEDSRGMYQISPICLKDWNMLHPNKQYTKEDLWDKEINEEIAFWYLEIRIPKMLRYYGIEDNITNRLVCYNAGIAYLVHKKQIPNGTKNYIQKYYR